MSLDVVTKIASMISYNLSAVWVKAWIFSAYILAEAFHDVVVGVMGLLRLGIRPLIILSYLVLYRCDEYCTYA